MDQNKAVGSSRDDTDIKIASAVSRLKSGGRLTIPIDCRRLLGWVNLNETMEILSERIALGHIRFHRLEDVRSRIDELRARLAKEARAGDPDSLRRLKVFMDRHRVVGLDKEGRLRLNEEVITSLGAKSHEHPDLYIEATADTLEVMSIEARDRFIEEYGDDPML